MNIKKILVGITTLSLLFVNSFIPAFAAQPWDVSGSFDIAFECLPGCGGPYSHDANFTQTGSSVDGDGGYPADGPYEHEWVVTGGSVSGDTINLTVTYDVGPAIGTVMSMTGTIGVGGSMSGTWTDNFGGSRNGTWETTDGTAVTKITTPTIQTPANGAVVTQSSLTEIDWTDATGTSGPFEYQYQAFTDAAYTSSAFLSSWLTASEIPSPGTAPGDYYLRVRARDAENTESAWSNGSTNPHHITVTADVTPTPSPSPDPFAVPTACVGNGNYNNAPIVGTNGSNTINGTSGDDLIFALGGSDSVNGGGGNDCIVGGAGSDNLRGGNGMDVLLGEEGSDSLDGGNNEDQLYGGDASDSLTGGNAMDMLFGENGNDSLDGGNADDTLMGGAGNDSLRGGSGTDNLDGEAGNDSANGGSGNQDSCTAEAESACEL